MVGILLSYWGGLFSGDMLVSGRVNPTQLQVHKMLAQRRGKLVSGGGFFNWKHRLYKGMPSNLQKLTSTIHWPLMGNYVRYELTTETRHAAEKYQIHGFSYDQAWLSVDDCFILRGSQMGLVFRRFFFAPCGIWLRNWDNLALLSCLSGKSHYQKFIQAVRQLVGCNVCIFQYLSRS